MSAAVAMDIADNTDKSAYFDRGTLQKLLLANRNTWVRKGRKVNPSWAFVVPASMAVPSGHPSRKGDAGEPIDCWVCYAAFYRELHPSFPVTSLVGWKDADLEACKEVAWLQPAYTDHLTRIGCSKPWSYIYRSAVGGSSIAHHVRMYHPEMGSEGIPIEPRGDSSTPCLGAGVTIDEPSRRESDARGPITSFFASSKKLKDDHPRQTAFVRLLVLMLVFLRIPWAAVESPWFKALVWFLDPMVVLPSSSFLVLSALPELADEVAGALASALASATGVAISIEQWTSRAGRRVLSLDAQYITQDWKLVRSHLGLRFLDDSTPMSSGAQSCGTLSSGTPLGQLIKDIVKKYSLTSKVYACIADQESAINRQGGPSRQGGLPNQGVPNLPPAGAAAPSGHHAHPTLLSDHDRHHPAHSSYPDNQDAAPSSDLDEEQLNGLSCTSLGCGTPSQGDCYARVIDRACDHALQVLRDHPGFPPAGNRGADLSTQVGRPGLGFLTYLGGTSQGGAGFAAAAGLVNARAAGHTAPSGHTAVASAGHVVAGDGAGHTVSARGTLAKLARCVAWTRTAEGWALFREACVAGGAQAPLKFATPVETKFISVWQMLRELLPYQPILVSLHASHPAITQEWQLTDEEWLLARTIKDVLDTPCALVTADRDVGHWLLSDALSRLVRIFVDCKAKADALEHKGDAEREQSQDKAKGPEPKGSSADVAVESAVRDLRPSACSPARPSSSPLPSAAQPALGSLPPTAGRGATVYGSTPQRASATAAAVTPSSSLQAHHHHQSAGDRNDPERDAGEGAGVGAHSPRSLLEKPYDLSTAAASIMYRSILEGLEPVLAPLREFTPAKRHVPLALFLDPRYAVATLVIDVAGGSTRAEQVAAARSLCEKYDKWALVPALVASYKHLQAPAADAGSSEPGAPAAAASERVVRESCFFAGVGLGPDDSMHAVMSDRDIELHVRGELVRYRRAVIAIPGTEAAELDPLRWWAAHAAQYPTVAEVARVALAVPGSLAEGERTFSLPGMYAEHLRNGAPSEGPAAAVFVSRNVDQHREMAQVLKAHGDVLGRAMEAALQPVPEIEQVRRFIGGGGGEGAASRASVSGQEGEGEGGQGGGEGGGETDYEAFLASLALGRR
eukprot:jgi/Mesvir1/925/Mv25683-RA.1